MEALPAEYHFLITPVGNDAETYNRDRRILWWVHQLERACLLRQSVDRDRVAADQAASEAYAVLAVQVQPLVDGNLAKFECQWSTADEQRKQLSKLGDASGIESQDLIPRVRRTLTLFHDPAGQFDEEERGVKFSGENLSGMNAGEADGNGTVAALAGFGIRVIGPAIQKKECLRRLVQAYRRAGLSRDPTDPEHELETLHAAGVTEEDVHEHDSTHLPRLAGTFLMIEPWHLTFALLGSLTLGPKTGKNKTALDMSAKRIVWHALMRPFLAGKYVGSKHVASLTDHTKQSMGMDFGDMYLYVGIRREAFLSLRRTLQQKYPLVTANPDVQLLWSVLDHLDPVTLDFIPCMKMSSEPVLMEHLAEVTRACHMLGNSTYLSIGIKLINDMIGLKAKKPKAYREMISSFCSLVTVYIEQQHALLTSVAAQHTRSDVQATNERLRQLPMHRAAFQFLLDYQVKMNTGYRVPNAQSAGREADRRVWESVIEAAFKAAATGGSRVLGEVVTESSFKCEGCSIEYSTRIFVSVGGTKESIDGFVDREHANNEAALKCSVNEPQAPTEDSKEDGKGSDENAGDPERGAGFAEAYLSHGKRSPRKYILMFAKNGRRNPEELGGLDYDKIEAAVEEIAGSGCSWSRAERAAGRVPSPTY